MAHMACRLVELVLATARDLIGTLGGRAVLPGLHAGF